MPKRAFERRSLELTAEQWAVLDNLAAQTNSLAPTGINAGKPTWRTLIRRVSDGEFALVVFDQETEVAE